ncbi:MAG: mucoidy inhibitor MuiA family protein [Gammaproteobacteria bacterium]|nr:mucoidy inhibitor MuiA family protein [Gammaproteobacteria bacterium]
MLLRPVALALLALTNGAVAAELTAPGSAISAVTVYPDRAQVSRSLTMELPAGSHTLLVEQLPVSLNQESLRVSGSGTAAVRISAVDLRPVYLTAAANERQRQLQQQLTELRDQEAGLQARQIALDSQSAFINALVASPAPSDGKALPALSPEQWPLALQAIGQGMRDIGEQRVKLAAEQRQLAERIAVVEAELNQMAGDQRATLTAAIHLETRGGSSSFKLDYQLPGARWAPVYDANLDTAKQQLAVTTAAYVQQATGEDWAGVALILATARPSAGTSAPELSPWWIDFAPVDDGRGRSAKAAYSPAPVASSMEMADSLMMERKKEVMEEEIAIDVAALQSADFIAEYQVVGKVTVAANNSRQRFVLAEQQFPVSLSLRAVPRLDPHAYLYATLSYAGKAPLLPGEWRLSRNGAYIGSRVDPLLRPGAERLLAFGVDDAVTLSYDQLADEKGESGLISKDSTLERRYRVTAESGHSKAVPLTLLDQLPVAQNEQIRVELLKESKAPSQTDVDDQKGVLAWELELKPGSKAQLDFGYRISYPGKGPLIGL